MLQPGYLRSILGLVAGHGLLTVTGDVHKQMRKTINPAFSIPNLMAREYITCMHAVPKLISSQRLTCTMTLLMGGLDFKDSIPND